MLPAIESVDPPMRRLIDGQAGAVAFSPNSMFLAGRFELAIPSPDSPIVGDEQQCAISKARYKKDAMILEC
jgi:hypothetical protein